MTGTRRGSQNFFRIFVSFPRNARSSGHVSPPQTGPRDGERKTYLIKTPPRKMCRRTCAFVRRPSLRVYPYARGSYVPRFADDRQPIAVSRWRRETQTVFVRFRRKIQNRTVDGVRSLVVRQYARQPLTHEVLTINQTRTTRFLNNGHSMCRFQNVCSIMTGISLSYRHSGK